MAKQSSAGWLVVVLAALGVIMTPRLSVNQGASATERPSESRDRSVNADSTTNKGVAALASPSPNRRAAEDGRAKLWAALAASAGLGNTEDVDDFIARFRSNGGALHAVLVSLPDPRKSHMAMYFDQSLDALRRAAAALGFSQDRFVLPWTARNAPPTEPNQESARAHENRLPGLMLFRRGATLLALVLVTESPVIGIEEEQIEAALELTAELSRERPELLLVGPFFSGGQHSLAAGISWFRAQHAEQPIRIISGTATAPEVSQLAKLPGVAFSRTVPDDRELVRFLFTELGRNRPRRPRTAWLTELGTDYGASSKNLVINEEDLEVPSAFGPSFTFPLHVSALRAVRERQDNRSSDPSTSSLRRTLSLKLDPKEEAELDLPPNYSELTPYVAELSLGQQLTRICRERIDYLVIAATDPVDVVFLAQESKKYCPGLSLVTLGADQLFRHPDLSSSLSGMLVATSYPLLFSTKPWVEPSQPEPFASQVANGIYNAFLAACAELHLGKPRLYQYAPALSADCPQVGPELWLTMIANGNFWPIATGCARGPDLYPNFTSSAGVLSSKDLLAASPTARRGPARSSGFAKAAAALVLFGLIFHGTALALSYLQRKSVLARLPFLAPLARRASRWNFPFVGLLRPAQVARRHLFDRYALSLNATLVLLAAAVLPGAIYVAKTEFLAADLGRLLTSSDRPRAVFGVLFISGTALGSLATCALCAAFLIEWLRMLKRLRIVHLESWRGLSLHDQLTAILTSLSIAWLVCAVVRWLLNLGSLATIPKLLLFTRLLDPLGMSPLVPVFYLAAGFYLWSICGLRRVQGLERFSERPPIAPRRSPAKTENRRPEVSSTMRHFWSGSLLSLELLVVTLFCLPGAYFWFRMLPTFEGRAYDSALKAGFILLYGAVVFAFVHFLMMSRLLLSFLQQLAAHPMADAYDRIARKVTGSFGLQFQARVPCAEELEVSGYSSQQLASLARMAPALDNDSPFGQVFRRHGARLQDNAHCVTQALGSLEASAGGAREERRAHEALFASSREMFRVLRLLWRLRTEQPALDELTREIPMSDLLPAAGRAHVPTAALFMRAVPKEVFLWMRMAEDFVAMRVATFIHHVLYQLRNLLSFALAGSLLLVLAIASYPLQPARFVTTFSWALVLIVVAAGLNSIVTMERNEVLSRLGGSTPGHINFSLNLISQLFVYVVLPIAAVLTSIFPEIGDLLFSWLGAIQRLLP